MGEDGVLEAAGGAGDRTGRGAGLAEEALNPAVTGSEQVGGDVIWADAEALEGCGIEILAFPLVEPEALEFADSALHAERGDRAGEIDAVLGRAATDPGAALGEYGLEFGETDGRLPEWHPDFAAGIAFV